MSKNAYLRRPVLHGFIIAVAATLLTACAGNSRTITSPEWSAGDLHTVKGCTYITSGIQLSLAAASGLSIDGQGNLVSQLDGIVTKQGGYVKVYGNTTKLAASKACPASVHGLFSVTDATP